MMEMFDFRKNSIIGTNDQNSFLSLVEQRFNSKINKDWGQN